MEGLVLLRSQALVLRAPGLIDRRIPVSAQVKPVVDLRRLGHLRAGGLGNRLPQIQRHDFDAGALRRTERLVKSALRGLGRAFGDHFPHRAWGAVAQAADGLESAMEALFIQLDVRDGAGLTAACPPARDGTLKEAFDVRGAQPQQLRGAALHLRTQPHVNGEALQEQGKASARFGPRQADGWTPHLGQLTRGACAWSKVSNWQGSKCRQVRVSE